MQNSNVKTRLIVLSFLQFAVWGAYLTSMGRYLGGVNEVMSGYIGWFYSVQGIVSIFMPAIIGIIADRWVPAQRLLGFCHAIAALFMGITGYMGVSKGAGVEFNDLFWTSTAAHLSETDNVHAYAYLNGIETAAHRNDNYLTFALRRYSTETDVQFPINPGDVIKPGEDNGPGYGEGGTTGGDTGGDIEGNN